MATKTDSPKHREEPAERAETEEPAPRLVYTQAPVLLARLIGPDAETPGAWRAAIGAVERSLAVDEAVDPALLAEASARGARVLVESAPEPTIVGVVQTQRAIVIDANDAVTATVRRFRVDTSESFLLKSPGAFVRGKAREVEVYGDRVLTRARDLARTLAAMIKRN